MADTVRETIRELLESTQQTIETLLALGDEELPAPSSHICAQGRDMWALLTNDIDHELTHAGQIMDARYEARETASPLERLLAEWLRARAAFIGSFVGMSDEMFNRETAPGQWTYRVVASHVFKLEQHSVQTILADREARLGPTETE